MVKIEARVRNNREVAQGTFLLTLSCDFPEFDPGQFVMLGITGTDDPFLRRPLAILSRSAGALELLYRVSGKGTELLAEKRQLDTLSVLGPLGKGFGMPADNEEPVFLAGGTGLPPILAMAERVKRGHLVFGARSAGELPLWNRLNSIEGVEAAAATEDGSLGKRGLATDALQEVLKRVSPPLVIYACGPKGMLRQAALMAQMIGARCEVSLEEYMACGFGVCSACAVRTVSSNRRVCTDGPVFDARDIRWEE
ncbi:MAG: dihydroorotate dehydrogenase electron transfer subunit [Desulfomonilia bacterium]|jgi:dihydroorotate dehydrogenase electron transfer subunit